MQSAIAAGYGWAREHEYRYCGRIDADGQHPAFELRRLLERVWADACDVAVGSRFVTDDNPAWYAARRLRSENDMLNDNDARRGIVPPRERRAREHGHGRSPGNY